MGDNATPGRLARRRPGDLGYLAGIALALAGALSLPVWDRDGPAAPLQARAPAPAPAAEDGPDGAPPPRAEPAGGRDAGTAPADDGPSGAAPAGDGPAWRTVEVRDGDSASAIFARLGLGEGDLAAVLNAAGERPALERIHPGYRLDFMMPEPGRLERLRVFTSPLEGYLYRRDASGFRTEPIAREAETRRVLKLGAIDDNLFLAGRRERIPAGHIMEMADIFGGVVDFILDPRKGDRFSILYERKYYDGEFVGDGDILATEYVNRGRTHTAVRYVGLDGRAGYYTPDGENLRKAFLRNPLDVFRITSGFSPRRRHPILNTIRAHRGTDYAAPAGTPVRATADGRVKIAARNGSFGNLVVLQHGGGLETKYAHLSRFAVREGDAVAQGGTIGYVGATGAATGPHLHYELLSGGVHQDPRVFLDRMPRSESVGPDEMDRFTAHAAGVLRHLQRPDLAGASSPPPPVAD